MHVIWDSEPWRAYLCADARAIEKRAATRRVTERRTTFIERTVLLAAYSMRRLDDAKQLSTSWKGRAVRCSRFPLTGKVPDFMDWHHLELHYDLANGSPGTTGARDFCDMIIHSFVFAEACKDDRSIKGIFVTSDRRKAEGLWLFGIDTIIRLFLQTAQDDPATAQMRWSSKTGEWDVWAGDGDPPENWRRKTKGRIAKSHS
jgi:hypothetical protein